MGQLLFEVIFPVPLYNGSQELANPEFSIYFIDDVNCVNDYCKGPEQAVQKGEEEGVLQVRALLNASAHRRLNFLFYFSVGSLLS